MYQRFIEEDCEAREPPYPVEVKFDFLYLIVEFDNDVDIELWKNGSELDPDLIFTDPSLVGTDS